MQEINYPNLEQKIGFKETMVQVKSITPIVKLNLILKVKVKFI